MLLRRDRLLESVRKRSLVVLLLPMVSDRIGATRMSAKRRQHPALLKLLESTTQYDTNTNQQQQ
jgi:hypothetical protein